MIEKYFFPFSKIDFPISALNWLKKKTLLSSFILGIKKLNLKRSITFHYIEINNIESLLRRRVPGTTFFSCIKQQLISNSHCTANGFYTKLLLFYPTFLWSGVSQLLCVCMKLHILNIKLTINHFVFCLGPRQIAVPGREGTRRTD